MGKPPSIIIFDVKPDYLDLPGQLGPGWHLLSVHDDGMRVGIGLDGVRSTIWTRHITTLFCARAGLVAAWASLTGIVRWLLPILNPSPGLKLCWPDLRLILDVIKSGPLDLWAGKQDYEKSLINALEMIESTGTLFRTASGLDLNAIIRRGESVVIDISNFTPPWIRSFLVELLISQVLVYRTQNYLKTDSTEVILVIDEADPLVSRQNDKVFADGASPLAQCLAMGREYGIVVILGLRLLGQTSRFILNSAHYHMMFEMADTESVIEAARALMLPDGGEQMFPGLRPGECIYRASQSCWPHAMLGTVDFVAPHRGPLPVYNTYPYEPSEQLKDMPHVLQALEKRIAEHRSMKARQAHSGQTQLPTKALDLLSLAAMYPYEPVAALWARKGRVSPSVQASVRKILTDRECAVFEEVRIGKRNVLLMEILEAGWKAMNRKPVTPQGRGGVTHRHFSHWIEAVGRKRGYTQSCCEWLVPGTSHHADAAWLVNGSWIIFEVVQNCIQNLIEHCRACLVESQAVNSVVIVTAQKSDLSALQTLIAAEPEFRPVFERIKFETITPYMEELFS